MEPDRHQHDADEFDDHDPDPMWDLDDFEDEPAGWRSMRLWVIVITVLIVLGLLMLLAWPVVADLLDGNQDAGGFPTPGPV